MATEDYDLGLDDYQKLFEKAKSSKQALEADWFLNLSYYQGDQWVRWNRGKIDRPMLADWRVKFVDNRILPAVDTRIARKTKSRPNFIATPFSADEKDRKSALLAEKVLEHDWGNLNLNSAHFRAMKWAELTGAGFWKIYWDSTQGEATDFLFVNGEPYADPNTGRPVRTDDGMQFLELDGVESKSISPGEIVVDVLSPFEVFPDPLATSVEDAEWIIEQKVRSCEYIREKYGVDVDEDTDVHSGIVESRQFPSSAASGTSARPTDSSTQYRGVTVYELWARPSTRFSAGRRAVWVKDNLLVDEGLDQAPYDGCPYVMFPGIVIPGRFWPTCVTTQLRGPQTELNKLRSQVIENGQRIGNPALMKSRQANVKYSGVPGEEILYDSTVPDAKPNYLEPPSMPPYIAQEIERIETSLVEISGMHEVSNASVPSGVTAASAINLLQEADDTRLGPEIAHMEYALATGGTKVLKLRAKYTSDQRLVMIAGDEGDWDVATYRGSMLETVTNVEVQAGSTMPRSKAAKQAAMQQMLDRLLQYGVEIDGRSLRKFFKEFEIGGLDSLMDNITPDELQTKREHMNMYQGMPMDINSFDNDDFHIEAHEEEQKSGRYAECPDPIKKIIATHVEAHRERRTEMVENQRQQQLQEQVQLQQLQLQGGQ